MAQKRMFSKQIVDSDAFLDMPATTQLLYFHLNMQADDDGFVGNPKKVIRMTGASEDDFKILSAKRFILTFESGVIVIKHWKLHNYIQKDRYHTTQYLEEKTSLTTKENSVYTERVQDVSKMDTEYRGDKVRLDKISLRESTPAEEAKEFFTNPGMQLRIFNEICELGNPYRELVGKEIVKFVEYWTELNKTGNKQRWEQEPTFEIKRRIKKWLSNIKSYQSKQTNAAQI